MKKSYLFILAWILSVIIVSAYTYENPEKIELVKDFFTKNKNLEIKFEKGDIKRVPGNSFLVELSQEISFTEKTAFITHKRNFSSMNSKNTAFTVPSLTCE